MVENVSFAHMSAEPLEICFRMLDLCSCVHAYFCCALFNLLCLCTTWSACSAAPHMHHTALTPRYVLHVFLSFKTCSLQCALALIIILGSYSILYTLLMAVRHSLHIQTPCHTQHLSLRALMINDPPSPCCSRRLFTPPVASKHCCAHARQSAACYLHACILVWCLAHVSTSCYS
jgi:hypothetical protein